HFGHLPYVMGEGNKKLSKRDPQADLFIYREQGFIPEGMVNYLALLGWGYSADEDIFTRDQLIERFDASDVNPNPARVDLKKATAINADHIRLLEPADLTARMIPYLQQAGVLGEHVTDEQHELLAAATPLVHTRMNLLGDAPDLLRFLFIADEELVVADDALKKIGDDPAAVLERAISELEAVPEDGFTAAPLEAALRSAIIDGMGIKPRLAFGPLRSAISGRRVSPPLFESMELLGKSSSLARLRALHARLAQEPAGGWPASPARRARRWAREPVLCRQAATAGLGHSPSRAGARPRHGCSAPQRKGAPRLRLPGRKGLAPYLGTLPGSAPGNLPTRAGIRRRRPRKRAL